MTIGEKIAHLRISSNISQERLARSLNVSRQSISKWESDESVPQIDKILEICSLFKISTDELLHDDVIIHRGKNFKTEEEIQTKYFGTTPIKSVVSLVGSSLTQHIHSKKKDIDQKLLSVKIPEEVHICLNMPSRLV